MTSDARRWVPRSALSSPLAVKRISECFAAWSKAWLPSGTLTAAQGWRAAAAGDGDVAGWTTEWDGGNDFSLLSRPGTNSILASALLGRPVQGRDLKPPRDKFVVSHVVRSALDDLAKRIGNVVGAEMPSPAASEARHFLPMALDQGEEILALQASETTLVELARESVGTAPVRPTPEARHHALASQIVGISALIGRSRLGLREIERLGIGDVLKLEARPDSLLDITVDGKVRGREAASLSLNEQTFEMQIQRRASEW